MSLAHQSQMQKGCELAENYRSFDMIQQTACVGSASSSNN